MRSVQCMLLAGSGPIELDVRSPKEDEPDMKAHRRLELCRAKKGHPQKNIIHCSPQFYLAKLELTRQCG